LKEDAVVLPDSINESIKLELIIIIIMQILI